MPDITPDQRRKWVRRVIGSDDLTSTQKNVLLALETYANYRDGTNAHPGEIKLAEDCGITTRAVRTALKRCRELGLIEQTADENPRAHLAAVYRIVILPTTGTAVPVNNSTTGTAVPVNNSTTGTATSPPPEQRFLPPESFTGTTRVLPQSGTSPEPLAAVAHTSQRPSRFCANHPIGTEKRCPDCANAREHQKAWDAQAAANDVAVAAANDFARRRQLQLISECPLRCRENSGMVEVLADDGITTLELKRCDHGLPRVAGDG